MTDSQQRHPRLAVLASPGTATATAVADKLRSGGWAVKTIGQDPDPGEINALLEGQEAIDALIYEPGLLDASDGINAGGVVGSLLKVVEQLRPHFRARGDGGARIVAISSRDGLGWPDRPHIAAAAGALTAVCRSLALQLGQDGATVNVVAALPPHGSILRDAGRPAGTHLREPEPLTPTPVTAEDIASTSEFFLDARSGYITGQVLYCCGGASLLSSLSV
ncbi:SDR family oxidoreductase [Arthrobacter sp. ISL-28]|uniref:SDR family oxidoreductase n=1 Tax=Arthrobacter sp. ISL-28 TaxID=2819108 RepID=UPI001BE9EBA6|nr:SDR family oxidoreductase [Arthrobacter sp. ISL-28]MBT2521839.1 SDR family oxidoreductase [Arthrobacter sp. ISL-28]